MEQAFSRKEALRFGWHLTKRNFWFFVGLLLITGIISSIPGAIAKATGHEKDVIQMTLDIIGTVFSIILGIGTTKIYLQIHDGAPRSFKTLLYGLNANLFFKYLVGGILYGLMVMVGLLLFIVPGIILSMKFQFFGYFIVDKGLGPIQALKASAFITRGAKWNLFIFSLLEILIVLLGALALFVGLLFAMPLISLAMTWIYRTLERRAHAG